MPWSCLALVSLMVVTAAKPAEEVPCEPQSPEAVLDCLAKAFNEEDLKALDRLLDKNFVLEYREAEEGRTPDPIDKKIYLKMMEQFVESDRVHDNSFSFSFEGEAVADSGGWTLDEVSYSWQIDGVVTETTGDSTGEVNRKVLIEKKNVTIRIQRPKGSETGYVVSRWTEDQ
jgi:hypothetical protein